MSDAALFDAIQSGDMRAMEEAFGSAEPVPVHNPDGWTPLHLAAFYGRAEMVEWLLEHAAEVHAVSDNAMANHPLHAALAGERDPAVVAHLITAGADVNARAAGGVTPLHLAAARGDEAMVRLLLEAGAQSAPMEDGKTPADLARERGHGEIGGLG